MKDPGIKTGGAGHACGAPSTGTTTEADMVATGLIAFQIKKILVPTDFSHCAEKALQYAIPFARHFGSELLLLHVIPPVIVLQTSEMMPQGIPEAEGEVQEGLEQLCKSIGHGIVAKPFLRHGNPAVEIVDTAKELEADLIIISTHGRGGLSHVLLGNTVEKVVRRASCPVLVVREHEHEFVKVAGNVA